jgi:hypothetical protein
MTSESAERWMQLVDELVATGRARYGNDDGIGRGRAFGSNALKTDGRIFTLFSHDRLVVKLPAKRVEALVTEGTGRRFDPGHGRLMREWLDVGIEDLETWRALAVEALSYVSRSAGRGA